MFISKRPKKGLTRRQTEVLARFISLSDKERSWCTVAADMNLSPKTVASHVLSIYSYWGVTDAFGLAIQALKRGVVGVDGTLAGPKLPEILEFIRNSAKDENQEAQRLVDLLEHKQAVEVQDEAA